MSDATAVRDARVSPLLTTVRLHTRLYANCLDGVSEDAATRRPSAGTNNVAFIAAHVADSRFLLAGVAGLAVENPLAARLAGANTLDELADCPTARESLAAWEKVSAPFAEQLARLDAAALDGSAPQRFPVDDRTLLGALAFLVHHEAYHIGQLALLRRQLGLPAMSYSARRAVA